MLLIKWFVYILLLVGAVTFTIVNNGMMTLSFFPFPYEVDLPFYILILMFFLIGAVIGNFATYGDRFALKSKLRKSEKKIHKLEEENQQLRNHIPDKSLIGKV